MLLRSLMVENWRCFVGHLVLGPFDDRLNVIHGPNGTGKSSLLAALVRGMFDRHDTQAKGLKEMTPWGRELTPAVTLELEHEGRAYRLMKRFLRETACTLQRREDDGRFVPIADGRAAWERAREFLQVDVPKELKQPKKGLSQATDWGLAQILWVPQQGMSLDQLSTDLEHAVQQSLGAQASDRGDGEHVARVEKLFLEVFTQTGRPKGGANAPFAVRLRQLDQLRTRRVELAQRLAEFEEIGRKIEDLELQIGQFGRDRSRRECDLQRTREEARRYAQARGDVQARRAALDASRANFERLQARGEAIRRADETCRDLGDRIERFEQQMPLRAREVEDARGALQQATSRKAELRTHEAEVLRAEKQAAHAEEYNRRRLVVGELQTRLARVEELSRVRVSLEDERARLAPPETRDIRHLETALDRRRQLQWKWDAALLHVEIRPETPLAIEVETAESKTETEDGIHIKGPAAVAFRIPGVGSFRAAAPIDSIESLQGEIEEAERRLREAVESLGTDDCDELRRRRTRGDLLERELDKTRAELDGLLQGADPESLRRDLGMMEQALEKLQTLHPDWSDNRPDTPSLRALAEQAREAFTRDLRENEAALETARERLARAEQAQSSDQTRLDETQRRLQEAEETHRRLCDDGKTPREREEELGRLALEAKGEEQLLREAEEALAQFAGNPQDETEALEGQLRELRARETQCQEAAYRLKGRLEQLASEAPHTRLAEIEEEIQQLAAEHERDSLRRRAIELLWRTVESSRKEMVDDLLAPVQRRAEQILARIAGPRLGSLELNDSFLAAGVAPPVAEQSIGLDRISGGEQEQVHFAVRMALADVLCAERTPLVFDDAFVASDAARLARIQKILVEASERFQVIVFTCHPERYGGVGTARLFDLEAHRAAM